MKENPQQVYALIGDPVGHSLSPLMQNLAFQDLDLNSTYIAFQVRYDQLDQCVKCLKTLNIAGFNVTIPHKVSILSLLDKISPSASAVGAVNTVVNDDGRLIGYNTDGDGALKALSDESAELKGKNVVLTGAGGAARAIAFSLASTANNIVIVNRTKTKALELAQHLNEQFNKQFRGEELSKKTLQKELQHADILINATSVGMSPNVEASIVKREMLRDSMTVFDIVYNPLETKLLKEARAAGAKTISGVKMLVYQGALSFELWTGKKAPIEKMMKSVVSRLEEAER